MMINFLELLPVLAKCCQDDAKTVVEEAKRVAILMGRLMKYDDWVGHALKLFEDHPSSIGVLRCLCWMAEGASPLAKSKDIEKMSKIISSHCNYIDAKHQTAVLDIAEQLIGLYLEKEKQSQVKALHSGLDELAINDCDEEKTDEHNEGDERFIFKILVTVLALTSAHDDIDVENRAQNLLMEFSKNDLHRTALNAKYIGDIISEIEDLDCDHSERSERILLLFGVIKFCGIQAEYFDTANRSIKLVLENSEASAKIKILTAVSIVSLFFYELLKGYFKISFNRRC